MSTDVQLIAEHLPVLVISDDDKQYDRLYLNELKVAGELLRGTIRTYRDLLSTRDVGLILVDSHGSDLEILDICREIRELSAQPLVLLTYRDYEGFLLSAYVIGVSECVVRPIGSQLLEAKIEAWLRWVRCQASVLRFQTTD